MNREIGFYQKLTERSLHSILRFTSMIFLNLRESMKELTQYPSMRITAKQDTHLNFALANESDKTPLSNFAVIHSNSLYNLYVNYAIPTFDLPTLHIRKHRNQKNVQTVTSMLYVETHFGTAFQRCCDYVMTCVSWVNVVCLDR